MSVLEHTYDNGNLKLEQYLIEGSLLFERYYYIDGGIAYEVDYNSNIIHSYSINGIYMGEEEFNPLPQFQD